MLSVNPSQKIATNAQMQQRVVSFKGKSSSNATRILSKVKLDAVINSPKLSHVEKRDQLVHIAESKLDKMGLFDKLRILFKK